MADVVAPHRKQSVGARRMDDGSWLLFDQSADVIHAINETAGFVWERCDGTHAFATICDEVCATYEVEPNVARQDVQAILAQFTHLGLLT
jgi:hypothetical protein